MSPRFLILSRSDAEAYEPRGAEVCISIAGPLDLPARLSPAFRSVLRLTFSDIEEDIPLPEHRLFDATHAQEVVRFISRWREVDQIVIHCRMGMSRSPAVALGICDLQGWPIADLETTHRLWNRWVRKELVRGGSELRLPNGASVGRNDPLATLRESSRLWARCEVLNRPSPVPAVRGLYAWFFHEVPARVPVNDALAHHQLTLLYVGIAPSRAASSSTLRSRIRQHYRGNASGSTLRLTLGCLLAEQLDLTLSATGLSGRLTFGDGEDRLSKWMAANAFVTWVEHPEPWQVEADAIERFRPPLNLSENRAHPFRQELSKLRQQIRRSAARTNT